MHSLLNMTCQIDGKVSQFYQGSRAGRCSPTSSDLCPTLIGVPCMRPGWCCVCMPRRWGVMLYRTRTSGH